MNRAEAERRIAATFWYHDFDFGDGLVVRPSDPHTEVHRRFWRFMETELDKIEFRGKSVLDIGCWDGYWSFYAEKRGAKSVLASDDASQNWAGSQGLLLAKELLNSNVEAKLNQSVYTLSSLNKTFDVVLFLGVYYHLIDPLYALAQVRHCCHPNTIMVIEGNVGVGLPPRMSVTEPGRSLSKFTPSESTLADMLRATYFTVEQETLLQPPAPPQPVETPQESPPPPPLGWGWRLAMAYNALRGTRDKMKALAGKAWHVPVAAAPVAMCPWYTARALWVCRPFVGQNSIHEYPPPFGLSAYDTRWARAVA